MKKTARPRRVAPKPSKRSTASSKGKQRLNLRSGEAIGKGLKTIACMQLERALAELAGNNVSPEPIHEARTSIKKVRAIIQLAAPALGSVQRNRATEILHNAALRLAPLRDSEVQVLTLDLLIEEKGLFPEEFASLRAGLADIAKQRRINDVRQIPRVRGLLDEVILSVKDWPLDPLQGKDVRRRIRRIYRRGRSLMEFCHESNSPDDFHALRKMVKQLWYAIRITSCFWPEKGSDLIQALALMGEMAGKERDLTLLAETLSQGPSNRPAEKLISMIREELPALRKAALGAASRFYESKPKVFVEVLNL